jgi:hypothetical protein
MVTDMAADHSGTNPAADIIQPNTTPMDRYPISTGAVCGKAAAIVF